MLTFARPGRKPPPLGPAVRESIAECVRGLSAKKGLFGLHAFEKLRDLLLDPRDKKGWPKAFPTASSLRRALVQAFRCIEIDAIAGMRGMYADFLEEAQDVLRARGLAEPQRRYRKLAGAWTDFAEALLPPGFPGGRETKELLRKRRDLHAARGAEAVPEIRRIQAQLDEVDKAEFGLEETERHDLLESLHTRLTAICEAERAALSALKSAV
jgi:hypothetical protein